LPARIYDGAETKTPTFHGVVVRKDFGEKYPEIVGGLHRGVDGGERLDAQESEGSGREDRGVDQDQQGSDLHLPRPGGVHTLDATIKPKWVEAVGANYAVLQKLNMIKELNIGAWVNDSYVRAAYKELGSTTTSSLLRLIPTTSPAPIRSATRRSTTPSRPARSGSRAAISFRSVRPSAQLLGVKKFSDRRQEVQRRLSGRS